MLYEFLSITVQATVCVGQKFKGQGHKVINSQKSIYILFISLVNGEHHTRETDIHPHVDFSRIVEWNDGGGIIVDGSSDVDRFLDSRKKSNSSHVESPITKLS